MKKTKYIFLVVGAFILILLFRSFGIDTTVEHIMKIGWAGFAIICSIFIFSNIFLSYAWRVLITHPVPPGNFYKFVLARVAGDSTSSINALGAAAGEPLKALYVKDIVPFKVGLATVVLDRMIHIVSNLLMVLTGMFAGLFVFQTQFRSNLITFLALLTFFIAFLLFIFKLIKKQKEGFLSYLIGKMPGKLKNKILSGSGKSKIDTIDEEIRFIFSSRDNLRHFYISLALHYFAIVISCSLEIYLIITYISPVMGFTFIEALFVYIFGFIATSALFFVPANVGTSEGSYSLALSILGYDPVIGLSVGIIRRFRTFVWAGIGIALLFYAGLIKKDIAADDN